MMTGHTWHPGHKHAGDRQWTSRDMMGRNLVWTWAKCVDCGARTAVSAGAGRPMCDECFAVEVWE